MKTNRLILYYLIAYLHLGKELSIKKLLDSDAKTQELDFLIEKNMIMGKRDTRFGNRVMKTMQKRKRMDDCMMNLNQAEIIITNDNEENKVVQENEDENNKDFQTRTKKPQKSEAVVLEGKRENRSVLFEQVMNEFVQLKPQFATLHRDGKMMRDVLGVLKHYTAVLVSGAPNYTEGKLLFLHQQIKMESLQELEKHKPMKFSRQ